VRLVRGSARRARWGGAPGGAGPSDAARLARNLGMGEVLFPAAAGIASAIGLLQAAPRVDLARTIVAAVDDQGVASLAAIARELSEQVGAMLDGVGSEGATITPRVDMQYTGQGYVIEVDFPNLDADEPDLPGTLRASFEQEYAAMYGYSDNTAAPRVTAITVSGVIEPAPFELPENLAPAAPDRQEHRDVYFPETGGYVSTAIYRRDELPSGARIEGPAVIEDGQCAVLLLPGDVATVDGHRNVLAAIGDSSDAGELLNTTTGEA
jgi:N-methylhydantoinase A